jgi:hypothetical protein
MTQQEGNLMERTKFNFLPIVAITAAAALTVTVASGASSKPKLSFVKSHASIQWTDAAGSSPGGGTSNANTQSLRITAAAGGGALAYTYGANETLVGIRGRKLSELAHLGFDSKGDMTNGSPRISLGTTGTNGPHTYFLSAYHCHTAEDANGWRTSNFINGADCLVFRDSEVAGYTWAAAVAVADANNETVVSSPSDWFLIVDESPFLVYVDRLSIYQWCWTGNGTNGIIHVNSGDCI